MIFTKMRKSMKGVIIFIVVVFAATLVYFGAPAVGDRAKAGPVAVVNGKKIDRQEFLQAYQQAAAYQESAGGAIAPSQLEAFQAHVLDQMVNGEIILQGARKLNVKVSNKEVDDKVAEIQKQFSSREEFNAALKQQKMSMGRLKQLVRDQLVVQKGLEKIQGSAKVTDADLRNAYEEVRARHILIQVPQGADGDAKAKAKAQEIMQQLLKGADFATLAKKYSEDPGSAKSGGDLNFFRRGQMVPEFEKVAFSLGVGEISQPVKTKYGYHIIKVEARKEAKGPDFEKVKKQLEAQLAEQKKQETLQKWFEAEKKNADIKVNDNRLAAYKAMTDGKFDQALDLYQKALKDEPQNGYIYADLARIYRQKKDNDKALGNLEQAARLVPSDASLQFSLGELYREKKLADKAVAAYQKASDLEPNNYMLHLNLKEIYKELNRAELAKAEEQKMAGIQKALEAQQKAEQEAQKAQQKAAEEAARNQAQQTPQPQQQSSPSSPAAPTQAPAKR
ncbi:MAG: peptidylprolyl isomerase [Firmicutes bacterium]|nr:peptidylprolyl isomerase [Bacillota bacterium]